MEVVATPANFTPQPTAKVAVKGKDAIVDAMEDIVFGSVCNLPFQFMNVYLHFLDCWHRREIHRISL